MRFASRPVTDNTAPPGFWRRQRRVILSTFFVVLFAGIVVTLFTAPTYQAVVRIAPPPNTDPQAERVRLLAWPLVASVKEKVLSQPAAQSMLPSAEAVVVPGSLGGGLAIVAEAGTPELPATYANVWADMYAAEVAKEGRGAVKILHAQIPVTPVRPHRAQNVLFAAMIGLVLGFALAQVKDNFQRKTRPLTS